MELLIFIFIIVLVGYFILNPIKSLTMLAKFLILFLVGLLGLGTVVWLLLQ
jgi:hypothetical protein